MNKEVGRLILDALNRLSVDEMINVEIVQVNKKEIAILQSGSNKACVIDPRKKIIKEFDN